MDKEQAQQLIAAAKLHLKGVPTKARGPQNDSALIDAIIVIGELVQIAEGAEERLAALEDRVAGLEAANGDESNVNQ